MIIKDKRDCFEELYKLHFDKLVFVAMKLVSSYEMAIDLSQDSFLKAFVHFDQYNKNKDFFLWIYSILKNVIIDYFRIKRNVLNANCLSFNYRSGEDNINFDFVSRFTSCKNIEFDRFEDMLDYSSYIDNKKLILSLDNLKKEHLLIFLFRFVLELSCIEISIVMGMKINEIRNRLCNSIRKIRKIMGKDIEYKLL